MKESYLGINFSKYPHLHPSDSKRIIRDLFLEQSIVPSKAKIIENKVLFLSVEKIYNEFDGKFVDPDVLESLEKENAHLKTSEYNKFIVSTYPKVILTMLFHYFQYC